MIKIETRHKVYICSALMALAGMWLFEQSIPPLTPKATYMLFVIIIGVVGMGYALGMPKETQK